MVRPIVIRDGVLYDQQWNAITPTFDELLEITAVVNKYTTIKLQEGNYD